MNVQQKKFQGIICLTSVATLFMALFLVVMASQKIQAQNAPETPRGEQISASQGGPEGRNTNMPPRPPRPDGPDAPRPGMGRSDGLMKGLGLIGAGIAFGLATLGAGVGIGSASSAAIGALSEKPSMFGISLVFVALCEGLVIFGFVIAAMIMGRI